MGRIPALSAEKTCAAVQAALLGETPHRRVCLLAVGSWAGGRAVPPGPARCAVASLPGGRLRVPAGDVPEGYILVTSVR
jgi:hypothetical protein